MLRQTVFSSIHLSTELRRGQTSVTYPSCSFCGGISNGKTRKVTLCQLSLYTNTSESFVVWYKKPEEPKGLLWLRSSHVRKGNYSEGNFPVELISKGCRGRCSYTLRFDNSVVDEWYRLLRQESKKNCEYDDELSDSTEEDSPLDRILSDTSQEFKRSAWSPAKSERKDSQISPTSSWKRSYKKPAIKNKTFRLQISSLGRSDRKISVPVRSVFDTPASPDYVDPLSRSWPVQV